MSFDNKSLRCRNCRFWWPIAEGAQAASREHTARGQCRRHAPLAAASEGERTAPLRPVWAVVLAEEWCGDHVHVGAGI